MLRRLALNLALGLLTFVIALPVLWVAWHALSARLGVLRYQDQALALPGLTAPVEIVFDARAVPHIFAKTRRDAMTALGYLHAGERLWQMELNRRLVAGRTAELVPLGEAVRIDRAMRTLGLYRATERSFARLSPEMQDTVHAYVAGVNAKLAELRAAGGPWPIEFGLLDHHPEDFTPADALVFGRLMALQLSGNGFEELRRAQRLAAGLSPARLSDLEPPYPADAPRTLAASDLPRHLGGSASGADPRLAATIAPLIDWAGLLAALPPPLGPRTASNSWVVSGRVTDTGRPLLSHDPHLTLDAPGLWYLVRIVTPEGTLAGASVPGTPGVIVGRNDHIAWGPTTTGSDTQDLFIERLDPTDPTRYETPEGMVPFTTREEVIRVRFGDPVRFTVRATRHGPVVSDLDPSAAEVARSGHVLALAFPGLTEADTTPEAVFRMNQARNWDEFRDALRLWVAPQQNITYADIEGNIGFIAPAFVPVRRAGDGALPVPGWTDAYDWTSLIPFDDLPQGFNPASGWFVNANNAVVPDSYPYRLVQRWEGPHRAWRIESLLRAGAGRTLRGHEAMLADTLTVDFQRLQPLLRNAAAGEDPLRREALRLLSGWDGAMVRDRPEPLIYTAWMVELQRALTADELAQAGSAGGGFGGRRYDPVLLEHLLTDGRAWCDDVATDGAESCSAILGASLGTALKRLSDTYGEDLRAWRWGDAHRAPLDHMLLGNIPALNDLIDISLETDGGNYTVNRGGGGGNGVRFPHTHGAGYRGIYDFADLQRSRYVIATGQSGNPFSRHWGDFAELWRDGQHVELRGSLEELKPAALGTWSLRPAETP